MTAVAERPMGPDVAGGLGEYLRRDVEGGDFAGSTIEFEHAPIGYLTKKGEPRKAEWRRYYVQGPDDEKRSERVSVTTLLDVITSKGGLPYWFEGGGIKGCHIAHQQGLLDNEYTPERAVEVVRARKLGAEAERDRAADRGLNLHALLQEYMETGKAPNPSQHPEAHRGFIRGLVGFLMEYDPEPIAVEQLVAAPEYAGRMDLVCRAGNLVTSIDLKSQENCGIYSSAHAQLALYNRAHHLCGGEEIERSFVVAIAADGAYRAMPLALTERQVMAGLEWYGVLRPVESLCESHNRREKAARK